MKLNSYQSLAMRTARVESSEEKIGHAFEGMVDEVGEIASALKKHRRYGKPLDRQNVIEECGDLMWFVSLMATGLGVTLEDIATANINKLRARFPDGFTEHDANVRDLNAEAVAMVGAVDGR